MIEAHTYHAYDIAGNVYAVRHTPNDLSHFLECAVAIGLPVEGCKILATRQQIEAACAKAMREGSM